MPRCWSACKPMATDHFGKVAGTYADHRPAYPAALFDWLANQCSGHALAWDCGAGSGQASVALAQHFNQVLATDMSDAQLAHALRHPQVNYRVALAHDSGLPDASADLVTVAQALHWFDLDAFYQEVRRVLKPGGLIAAWSYGVIALEGDTVNQILQHFYHQIIGPYWPAERHHVETGYRELPFPFERLHTPDFAMEVHWTLPHLLGYLRSWSACARYRDAHGIDPVDALSSQLQAHWDKDSETRRISWPLSLLTGR